MREFGRVGRICRSQQCACRICEKGQKTGNSRRKCRFGVAHDGGCVAVHPTRFSASGIEADALTGAVLRISKEEMGMG